MRLKKKAPCAGQRAAEQSGYCRITGRVPPAGQCPEPLALPLGQKGRLALSVRVVVVLAAAAHRSLPAGTCLLSEGLLLTLA